MRTLYRNLIRRPAPSASVLSAAYHWGVAHDLDLAVLVVAHQNAPADVLSAASASQKPALRAAWLTRKDRAPDELVSALKRERRGDVLAALVAHSVSNPEMLTELAKLRKRPVAWSLIEHRYQFTEPLCDDAVAAVLSTLGPSYTRHTYDQRSKLLGFASAHPAQVAELLDELTDPDLALTATKVTLPVERLEQVIECTIGAVRWVTDDALMALLAQENLTLEHCDRIARSVRNGPRFAAAVKKARQRIAGHDFVGEALSDAATSADNYRLSELLGDVTLAAHRSDIVRALATNPNQAARTTLGRSKDALERIIDIDLARQIVAVHGENTLLELVAGFATFRPELLDVTADPARHKATVAAAWMHQFPHQAEWLIANDHFGPDQVTEIQWRVVTGTNNTKLLGWIDTYLDETLGDVTLAWETLAAFGADFTGTFGQLVALAKAAVTSPST
jgi:hypothetical protein